MTDEKVKVKRGPGGGRKPLLQAEHLEVLREIVSTHPLDSLGELTAILVGRTDLKVSSATVRQALKGLGVVRQVVPHVQQTQGDSELPPLEGGTGRQSYRYNESHRFQGSECDYPSSLTNAEWTEVSDIFEIPGSRGKPPQYPRRMMVNAMLYVVRGGSSWRMLPSEFPPWHQVFKTFRRWAALGRFETMYDRLRAMIRERADRSIEPTAAVIDSQSVKTSPQGGAKGYDAGKKVKGRKRHLLVDTLGLLLAVLIHPANIQDRDGSVPVVDAGMAKYPSILKIYADGAYGGKTPLTLAASHPGLTVEIVRHPANRNIGRRSVPGQLDLPIPLPARNFVPLPMRWVVERTHAWNDRFRRLGKDHDRTTLSSTAWIWFGEARILLRRLVWDPENETV